MTRSKHRVGRPQRTARLLMFAEQGTICWLCGHEGAGEADHADPISLNPDQPVSADRMMPAHGSSSPCHHPDCVERKKKPRSCNQERGNLVNRKRTATYAPRMAW